MAYIRHFSYPTWLLFLLTALLLTACGSEKSAQSTAATVSQSEITTRASTQPTIREPTATPVRSVPEQSPSDESWAVVTSGPLNLRAGPSTEFSAEAILDIGECLAVQDSSGTWMQLRLSTGNTGWSHADYLEIVDVCPATVAPAQQVVSVSESWGVVTADLLNVRAGPGVEQNVVTQLVNGTCVEVLAEQGEWLNVRNSSTTGWSSREFVRLVETCPAVVPQPIDEQPVEVQPVVAEPVAPAPAQPVANTNSTFTANAATIVDTHIHECFGGGENELRFVSAGTPIQVLGVGDWMAPIDQYAAIGEPPYLKIRIWDGQHAWIAAAATNVDPSTQPTVLGICEPYEQLNWEVIEQARPTATATTPPVVMSTPVPAQSCCRICRAGKACGNSCIAAHLTCRVGPGCACNG